MNDSLVKRLLPRTLIHIFRSARSTVQRALLPVAISLLPKSGGVCPSPWVIALLRFAWGNPWAASVDYIVAACRLAVESRQTILECGSGLTTIVIGHVVRGTGARLFSLENDREWHHRMSAEVQRLGLDATVVLYAPLVSYQSFDWYEVPPQLNGVTLDIILCDGPPGSVRGGRSGAMFVIGDRVSDRCRILVDDVYRAEEREMVNLWLGQFPFRRDASASTARFDVLVRQ